MRIASYGVWTAYHTYRAGLAALAWAQNRRDRRAPWTGDGAHRVSSEL